VDESDEASTALAIREGKLCPSGRLVTWDKETKVPLEEGLVKTLEYFRTKL